MNPLVSVVIPTYNHAHFLGRALQSVLDQTYTNWEAIVIDNHSQDNTSEVMSRFSDPRISMLKIHNKGIIAASRNMGIGAAKGEWIAFLDSDDWWMPNKLKRCVEYINDDVDLIYHGLKNKKDKPSVFQKYNINTLKIKSPVLINLLVNGNTIYNSSVFVRKCILDKIGGIDDNPSVIAAEDYSTWLRIACITDKFYFIPKYLGYYMLHAKGVSNKDMSIPDRISCQPYLQLLNSKQMRKFEARLNYVKGRFAYISRDFSTAKINLIFSIRYSSFNIKFKAIFMLFMLIKGNNCYNVKY